MIFGATIVIIGLAITSPISLINKGFQTLQDVWREEFRKELKVSLFENKSTEQIIAEIAILKGVSVSDMLFLAKEGGYNQNPCVQSNIYKNRVRENSWGTFQINLDWHPEVTKEQACDLIWSANWTADRILEGHIGWWTSTWNTN